MSRSHRHREVELNFVEEGSIRYLLGSTQVTVGAGRLALFWAAVPHQLVRVGTTATFSWLTVPLALFLQWHLPDALTSQVLHGKLVWDPDPTPKQSDRALFQQWHEDLTSGLTERRKIVILEIEARLRRLALSVGCSSHQAPNQEGGKVSLSQGDLGKAEQMAHFVAEHYRQALHIENIAHVVNLHPNYAMSLFRQTFSMSLIEYLTEHRIAHAQRLLATTDDNVLNIALECGLGSLSRFYTVF
jgi:AraC-like DNA-binding protein